MAAEKIAALQPWLIEEGSVTATGVLMVEEV